VSPSRLVVALPRGRLMAGAMDRLAQAGIEPPEFTEGELSEERDGIRYLRVRALDVPVLVARGLADAGVAGLDALRERTPHLSPALDLGYGRCRLSVAGPRGQLPDRHRPLRLATRYARLGRRYLAERRRRLGVGGRVVPLLGAVELAPSIGLAPFILDVVETGRSLRAHDLWEVEVVLESSAHLVVAPGRGAERAAFLVERLARAVAEAEGGLSWTARA
jgi:ATP phosphoribosyltransferase